MRFLVSLAFALSVSVSSAWPLTGGEVSTIETFSDVDKPQELIPDYTIESVSGFLTELGVEWGTSIVEGQQVISANIFSALVHFLPMDCDTIGKARCTSLQMLIFFDGAEPTLQQLNDFSRDNGFAFVGHGRDGGYFVRRDDLEFAGVPRQNFAAAIFAFRLYIRTFLDSFNLALDVDSGDEQEGTAAAVGLANPGEGASISAEETAGTDKRPLRHPIVKIEKLIDALSEQPGFANKVKQK